MQNLNNIRLSSWNKDTNFRKFTKMAYIDEGGYGVANSDDDTTIEGFHTNNISTCIAVAAHNIKTGKIFFAHFNPKYNSIDSMINAIKTEGFDGTSSQFYCAYNSALSSDYTNTALSKIHKQLSPLKIVDTQSAAFGITLDGKPYIPNSERDNTTTNGRLFYRNQMQELHGLYHQDFCQKQDLLPTDLYEKNIGKLALIKQFNGEHYIGDDGKKLKPHSVAFYRDLWNNGRKVVYNMNQNDSCCSRLTDYLKGNYVETQITMIPTNSGRKTVNSNLFQDKTTEKAHRVR